MERIPPSNAVMAFLSARPGRPYHVSDIHNILAGNYDLSYEQVSNAAAALARHRDIPVRRLRRGTYQYEQAAPVATEEHVVTATEPPQRRLCVVMTTNGETIVARFVGFVVEE